MAAQTTFDIFLNYRRQDTRADAGRLYDRLSTHFGDNHVFMDIDDIEPGQNFIQVLENSLEHCATLLVLIGTDWLDSKNKSGARRLDQPNDFVRLEIQRALERKITLIPILVGDATMPRADELPPEIVSLCHYQAMEISDQRFHLDVNHLIAELENINACKNPSLEIRSPRRWGLATVAIFGMAIVLYFGIQAFQGISQEQTPQYTEQHSRERTGKELEKIPNKTPETVESYLILVSAHRERLLQMAFLGNSSLDIGLRRDYDRFSPVESTQIHAALNLIYRAQALDPSLKENPDLLLEEALVLKASGSRAKESIAILEKAKLFGPRNAAVLAELGLLNTVLLKKPEGIKDIRLAVKIQSNEARYHFYLARALAETYLCPDAGLDYSGSGDAKGCALAIKEYRRAANLAAGEDDWSQHIHARSITSGLAIFHRYSRKENNILSPHLAMPIDERIEALEYLIPRESDRNRTGWEDEPRYWLAQLYESKNRLKKAVELMQQLLKENDYRSVLWLNFQAKLLRKTGYNPEELTKIRVLLNDGEQF